MDNILPGDIYAKSKELRFDGNELRAVFLVRFYSRTELLPFDIIQNMYIDAIYVPDDSVSSIKSLINGNADFIKPISQKPA